MTTTTKTTRPTTAAKKTMPCHKCGGSGYMPAYAGIANGVCFTCNGAGTVAYRVRKENVKPLTPCQAKMIEDIRTIEFAGMSYARLADYRNSAHWHYPQAPDLLAVWKARGEEHFQAAQAERLRALYG